MPALTSILLGVAAAASVAGTTYGVVSSNNARKDAQDQMNKQQADQDSLLQQAQQKQQLDQQNTEKQQAQQGQIQGQRQAVAQFGMRSTILTGPSGLGGGGSTGPSTATTGGGYKTLLGG